MRGVSIAIPLFLAGAAGYVLYLVAEHLLWEQFMRQDHRPGLAVGFIVPYAIVAALMVASYLRIFITARVDPAVVPLGPEHARYYHGQRPTRGRARSRRPPHRLRPCSAKDDADAVLPVDLETGLSGGGLGGLGGLGGGDSTGADGSRRSPALPPPRPADPRLDPDSPGLELFYTKDVFECSIDGRPVWCNECGTWKPDRTHHSSELNRCIRKLDHYCPWVGGVVSETTFKFFVQFNVYATILCGLTVGISAYALARRHQQGLGTDARVIVALALAGFLGLFASTMASTCLHLALTNQTSVEMHQRLDRNRPRQIAVRIRRGAPPVEGRYNVVTYPLPKDAKDTKEGGSPSPGRLGVRYRAAADMQELRQSRSDSDTPLREFQVREEPVPTAMASSSSTAAAATATAARDLLAFRTFAILPVQRRMNMWDLGWRQNWVTVMGEGPLDWLLPMRLSPCSTSDPDVLAQHSFYRLGPAFQRLCAQYNLPSSAEMEEMR